MMDDFNWGGLVYILGMILSLIFCIFNMSETGIVVFGISFVLAMCINSNDNSIFRVDQS